MPHIHTEPGQYDFTTSGYIVRLDQPEPAVMLHKHRLLKTYLQFGGHVELDEDPWKALVHELKEESGYEISQLELLQPRVKLLKLPGANLHPYPLNLITHTFTGLDHYHTDIAYAFVTKELPKLAVGKKESGEFKLFTRSELKKAPASELHDDIKKVCLFILDECLKNWKRVSLKA